MTEGHKKAIDKLIRLNRNDPENIALIICGSLAREEAREDSDVDLYLVVTDEKFDRIKQTKSYFYGSWNPGDYFGLGVDGKIIGIQFLRDAVLHAGEPTRASFQETLTLFSRSDEIEGLIKKICVYPEQERGEKIRSFYAYIRHYRYEGESAFKKGNLFYSNHCVMELVFFAGRLVLAHNHVLFPCHKGLFRALEKCADIPNNFIEMSHRLLENTNLEEMLGYYEKIINFFKDYDYPDNEQIGLILENEWTWYTGKINTSDC